MATAANTMATLSIADAFFLEELQATVGHRQARTWLSSTRAKARSDRAHQGSSSSSTSQPSTPLTRSPSPPPVRRYHSGAVGAISVPSRVKHDAPAAGDVSEPRLCHFSWSSDRAAQPPHSPADAPSTSEDDERVKRVLRTGGRDACLVFTDAAHCVWRINA